MFEKHWFLFVVDLKNKYFLLLDSYYSKDEEFSIRTRKKLVRDRCISVFFLNGVSNYLFFLLTFCFVSSFFIPTFCSVSQKEGFCHAWGLFVGPNERFSEFRTAYPRVPKQDNK